MLQTSDHFQGFWRCRSGVTAVEAALLLPVVLPTLLMVFELLFFVYASNSLDYALRHSVIKLRLGTAEDYASGHGWSPGQYYKQSICEALNVPNCSSNVDVLVEVYDEDGQFAGSLTDQYPQPGTLTFVQADVSLPSMVLLSQLSGSGSVGMRSALTFLTEP